MKKIYFLKTCDTCRRILKSIPTADFQLQEIKTTPITEEQLAAMVQRSKSYEALFSKRAKKYTAMGLKHENLKEIDFKQLLLQEYTFLKRPVIIVDDDIYIGNSPKTIAALQQRLT